MSKEADKKIAEWMGFKVIAGSVYLYEDERGWYRDGTLPNYSESNIDAITLLPVLVEKGYTAIVSGVPADCHQWDCRILSNDDTENGLDIERTGETMAEAISEAALALIESI